MARYFTPTPSQYISQFVPPDLDLMYKVGQEKAANDAAITDSLDKADQEWKVKGGIFTNKQDAELFNQETEANLSKIKDAFYTGSIDAFQAARAINRLQGVVKNNPKYRLYKLDEKLTEGIMPNLVSGKLNQAIGVPLGNGLNSIDLRGGQLKVNTQIDPNSTTEEQLANLYNAQTPGDFAKDHPDFIQQASLPKIIDAAEKSGYRVDRSNPNMPVFVNYKTGHTIKGITKETVRPFAKKYAEENYYSTSRESVEYMRRAGETVDDYADRLSSLIMDGITDKNVIYDVKGSPMSTGDGNSNETKKPEKPIGIPEEGPTNKIGFNRDKTKKETFMSRFARSLSYQTTTPTKKEDAKIQELQFKELDENTKNIVTNYVREYGKDKRWSHLLDKNGYLNELRNLPQGTLKKLYDEIANLNKDFQEGFIKSNNTSEPISYISPTADGEKLTLQQEYNQNVWTSHFGANPTITFQDVFNSGHIVYDLETMEKVKTTDVTNDLNTKIPLVRKFTPENLLPIMTGNKTMYGGIIFTVNDKNYVIKDRTTDNTDIEINKLYNKLVVNRNMYITEKITVPEGTYNVKFKLDNNNKVHIANSNNKKITEFDSVTDAFNGLLELSTK